MTSVWIIITMLLIVKALQQVAICGLILTLQLSGLVLLSGVVQCFNMLIRQARSNLNDNQLLLQTFTR